MDALLVLIYEKPVKLKGTSPLINGGSYEIVPKNFNLKGQLLMFEYQTQQYIYVSEIDYFERHRKNKSLKKINGYCKLSSYENYKRSAKIEDFLKLENWFDQFQFADIGDLFKIEKVELEKSLTNSFSKYFILSNYEFKITSDKIDFSNTLQYPAENTDPSSPNYCKILVKDLDQEFSYSTVDEGKFFTKNFKNKLPGLSLADSSKQLVYEGIIKICFRIDLIFKNIIDILAIESKQNILTFIKNIPAEADVHDFIDNHTPISPITTIYFTKTDKTIAHLLVDWGYKDFVNTKDFALEINGDQFYEGLYKPFNNYYNALVNLYQNIIGRTESSLFDSPSTLPSTWDFATLTGQDNKRFQFLSLVLPSSAIALLSPKERISLIDNYINLQLGDLSTEAQDNILKIMHSFYLFPEDGQKFMDFLLDKKDNIHTNFERLFNKFDDDNIRQISPVVGFFANEKTNRRNFIYGLYEIWKKTSYDFRYIPPNETPNEDGINPNSFFLLSQNQDYYNSNKDGEYYITLELSSETITANSLKTIIETEYKVGEFLQAEKVEITKIVTYNRSSANTIYLDPNLSYTDEKSTMIFHLYQPINMIGYEEFDNLKEFLPQDPLLPAFVYYYCKEYKKLADINAKWSAGIDISVELLLFFATGGVGIIKDLKYLKYVTKIGKALRATAATQEVVMTLRGAEVGFELFTVTTAICYTGADYIAKTTNSEGARKLASLLFWLTMLGAGATIYARIKATRAAKEIAANSSIYGSLPDEVKPLVNYLAGAEDVAIATFRTNLQNKYPKFYQKFIELSNIGGTDYQRIFIREFENANPSQFSKMESAISETNNVVANWKSLFDKKITDRNVVDVITNEARIKGIVRYYTSTNPELRKIIEPLTYKRRWDILDEIGNNINYYDKFVQNSKSLEGWIRYRYEPNFINVFSDLSSNEASLFRFLEKYSNISDEAFKNLKLSSVHNGKVKVTVKDKFERLLEYQDATHDIDKFNTRRAEMLPPNFIDGKTKQIIRLHEVDNYIELELKINKKLRASLENEAGDVIDDITGSSYDTMGIPHNVIIPWTNNGVESVNHYFGKYLESISDHFGKINKVPPLDYVVIDYKYFDEISLAIDQQPNYLKNQIDQYIIQNHNGQINKLIKLNY